MARKAAKNVRGTERYRDERRGGDTARMHGREWHDHDAPHELERERFTAGDALIEAESSGERTGMGRRQSAARAKQSSERRKRSVPPSKGPKKAKRI